jgi:ribosomal protein S5
MFEYKDQKRIEDIVTKSQGSWQKQIQFAGNMARAIKDANKALRRAEAATALRHHHIAKIFYIRYGELSA